MVGSENIRSTLGLNVLRMPCRKQDTRAEHDCSVESRDTSNLERARTISRPEKNRNLGAWTTGKPTRAAESTCSVESRARADPAPAVMCSVESGAKVQRTEEMRFCVYDAERTLRGHRENKAKSDTTQLLCVQNRFATNFGLLFCAHSLFLIAKKQSSDQEVSRRIQND